MKNLEHIDDPLIYFQSGKRWMDRIAPLALPILLAAAKAGKAITYSELAHRLNELHAEPIPKSFRNYGWPPGKIGDTLIRLSKRWGEDIPPLGAIVVNEGSRLPGAGAYIFIDRFVENEHTNEEKRILGEMALRKIAEYPKWDAVAKFFGIVVDSPRPRTSEPPIDLPPLEDHHRGLESEEHKELKAWVRDNPVFLAENFGPLETGINEFVLRSGDRLDVYFESPKIQLAVEVKARNAPDSELFRGVFQCVKYRAVLRAAQLALGLLETAQATLVSQRRLPDEVVRLASRLQIICLDDPRYARS